jgi:hypothetical protein
MADVTVSAAGVAKTATTIFNTYVAGATITAGQAVYLDSAASYSAKPCIATALASSQAIGIALNGAATGQPVQVAQAGDLTFTGTTFLLGTVYVVSANAGGIAPCADLDASTATNYGTVLGIASTATNLKLAVMASSAINP